MMNSLSVFREYCWTYAIVCGDTNSVDVALVNTVDVDFLISNMKPLEHKRKSIFKKGAKV